MLHVVLMGSVIGLDVLLRDTTWISRTAVTFFPPLWCVSSLLSPSPLYFLLCLIYPASRPWGATALGRLLTREKRAFNVMSMCRKAWQRRGPGPSSQGNKYIAIFPFSECNGLDITSPLGHCSSRILNPYYRVCLCVRSRVVMSTECVCTCVFLCMYGVGAFEHVAVGGLYGRREAICPLERKWITISAPHQLETARQP